jgi:hypothetical protein
MDANPSRYDIGYSKGAVVTSFLRDVFLVLIMASLCTPVFSQAGQPGQSQPEQSLHIGGYGSFRFEANDLPGSAKGFTFRRFVVTTDAKLSNRLRVYSETEFERLLEIELEKGASRESGGVKFTHGVEGNNGAEVGLEQLWLQYDLGGNQAVRAGIILPPLGRFNINHDDDYYDVPRRTLVDRDAPVIPVKSAWREAGTGLVGSFNLGAQGKLNYQAYVMSGATMNFNLENIAQTRVPRRSKLETEVEVNLQSGAVDGSQNANAFSWRAAVSPKLAGEIAVSGYHGKYTPGFMSISEPINAWGLDGKWRFGGFEVEGEGIYSTFGNTRTVAANFAQAVANSTVETSSAEAAQLESEIELELKGLARRRYGFWTDFKYHWRPAFLKNSFLGKSFDDPQIIPILRYDRVWIRQAIDELAFRAGAITAMDLANREQHRITAGINFRPIQNVGFQFAYERNGRRAGGRLIFPEAAVANTNGFVMGATFSF